MKISILAQTDFIQKSPTLKEEFDNLSGKAAGICYLPADLNTLLNEPDEKTKARINQTKNSKHLSVYDHASVSLYLEDIPKALAMLLNNEKMYNTSEKSARYTKMVLKEEEKELYNKWLNKFKELITSKYQEKYPKFFTNNKIEKLAQENARYLISVFTPTSMLYTVQYGQLNRVYHFLMNELETQTDNKFRNALKPYIKEFCEAVSKVTGLVDERINADDKKRKLSLFSDYTPFEEFGDTYSTSYKASFAELAQTQRHRTIWYSMSLLETDEFYLPKILRNDEKLRKEWLEDCKKQSSVLPQGMLININEQGTLENFILKMKERKCSFAQLEINDVTNGTLKKYLEELERKNHPRKDTLKAYSKGARCTFPDYICPSPCGFIEGINETREI